MAESFEELLQLGIQAARSGQMDVARQYLALAIQQNPQSEVAWLWMSGVLEKTEDRIRALQQVIAINPYNEMAIKGLRAMGVDVSPPGQEPPSQPSPPPPEPEPEPPSQMVSESGYDWIPEPGVEGRSEDLSAPGTAPLVGDEVVIAPPTFDSSFIPIPDAVVVANAQRQGRVIAGEITEAQRQQRLRNINWAPPVEAGRGRKAVVTVRRGAIRPLYLYIFGGIIGLIVVGFIGSTIFRRVQSAIQAANATATPTPTDVVDPTATVTPQPTRTPTPQGEPLTPEPSVTPGRAPRGDLDFGATPTDPYIATPHRGTPLGEAQTAFYLRDYEKAIDLAREARDEGDMSPDGYYYEAASLEALGRLDEARDIYEAGINSVRDFAPNHAGLARILAREGASERAQQSGLDAKTFDQRLLASYLVLARIYADNPDLVRPPDEDFNRELSGYAAALAEIEQARDLGYQYDVNLLTTWSELLLEDGQAEQAVAIGNLAVFIDPSNEAAIVAVNAGRIELGLYNSAIISLEGYLDELNPSSTASWSLLAEAYRNVGRNRDAFMAYGRVEQLAGSRDLLLSRGILYFQTGDYEAAFDDLSVAVDSDPDNVEARLSRALSLIELGRIDEALEDIEFLREEDPSNVELDVLYVKALVENGENEDAIFEATTLLSRSNLTSEQRGRVFEARAQAHVEEGNASFALNDASAALEIEETVTRHYLRGRALELLNQPRDAVREYEFAAYWGSLFDNPVAEDAASRLEALTTEP